MYNGRSLGTLFLVKKSCYSIFNGLGLYSGNFCSILLIRLFANADIWIALGNAYFIDLIFLYVVFTSGVSNGGLPTKRVYLRYKFAGKRKKHYYA